LTERTSLTTVQGTEWLPGNFTGKLTDQRTLQGCLNGRDALSCVEENARRLVLEYDYIYVANQNSLKNMCRAILPIVRGENLILELENNKGYESVYQTDEVSIFYRRH
jgi:hypothetical protein